MNERLVLEREVQGQRPSGMGGLRHVALFVADLEASLQFYVDLLGMVVEWEPDSDNVYLTSGNDNLALHRIDDSVAEGVQVDDGHHVFKASQQRLDHIGFIIDKADEVDAWYAFLKQNHVTIKAQPKTQRDGARSA